jgi:F0F1-type ATP synthase membrane subunit b/b'
MTPSQQEINAHAESERQTLIAQARREHLSNVDAELARYKRELTHIDSVFKLRIGQEPAAGSAEGR